MVYSLHESGLSVFNNSWALDAFTSTTIVYSEKGLAQSMGAYCSNEWNREKDQYMKS